MGSPIHPATRGSRRGFSGDETSAVFLLVDSALLPSSAHCLRTTPTASGSCTSRETPLQARRSTARRCSCTSRQLKGRAYFPRPKRPLVTSTWKKARPPWPSSSIEKAYDLRKSFYIPDDQYAILYKLANLFEMQQLYKQMEDTLGTIVADDKRFQETPTSVCEPRWRRTISRKVWTACSSSTPSMTPLPPPRTRSSDGSTTVRADSPRPFRSSCSP